MKLVEHLGTTKQHFLYEGDNLQILCSLEHAYLNKVDVIYIDPPYNTGKKMGKYKDSFKSHTAWVAFMRPRLVYAKKLLSPSGVIFISIGETEEAHLKILCDEIFGEVNKVSSIVWQSRYTTANDKNGISTQTEYILVYAKNIKKIKIKKDPLNEQYVKDAYSKNLDNDPRGPWRQGIQLYKKKNKKMYTVTAPNGKKWTKPWNYSEKQWNDVLVKNDLLYWGKSGNSCPTKKAFLKDTLGTCVKNLWLGSEVGYTADGGDTLEKMFGDRNIFLYPKPVSLLNRIIEIAAKPNSSHNGFLCWQWYNRSSST